MRHWVMGAFLLASLGAHASGCAIAARPSSQHACARLRSAYAGLSADQLAAERRWVEAALAEGAPAAEPQLHLRLALLGLHHQNPSPDYARALEELRAYADTDPAASSCPDLADWLRALDAIGTAAAASDVERRQLLEADNRELRVENANLRAENRQLRKRNGVARTSEGELRGELQRLGDELARARDEHEELARKNARLQDNIDRLQYLDFQMERKRRAMK